MPQNTNIDTQMGEKTHHQDRKLPLNLDTNKYICVPPIIADKTPIIVKQQPLPVISIFLNTRLSSYFSFVE